MTVPHRPTYQRVKSQPSSHRPSPAIANISVGQTAMYTAVAASLRGETVLASSTPDILSREYCVTQVREMERPRFVRVARRLLPIEAEAKDVVRWRQHMIDQSAFWNGLAGARWVREQAGLD